MPIAIVLAALITIGGQDTPPRTVQEMTPNEQVIRTWGIASYVIGMCAHLTSGPAATQRALDALSWNSLDDGPAKRLMSEMSAQMYQRGRDDPRSRDLTPENCLSMIEETVEAMDAAADRVTDQPRP